MTHIFLIKIGRYGTQTPHTYLAAASLEAGRQKLLAEGFTPCRESWQLDLWEKQVDPQTYYWAKFVSQPLDVHHEFQTRCCG